MHQGAIWRTIAAAASSTIALVDLITSGEQAIQTSLRSHKPMTVQSGP
jgi:hypothetical protein